MTPKQVPPHVKPKKKQKKLSALLLTKVLFIFHLEKSIDL